jgi:hypothetical protein
MVAKEITIPKVGWRHAAREADGAASALDRQAKGNKANRIAVADRLAPNKSEDLMKIKFLLAGTTLALTGWFALASASALKGPSLTGQSVAQNEQVAENDQIAQNDHGQDRKDRNNEFYQGQRGQWDQKSSGWQWHGAQGDEWYQGRRGHWYMEHNRWQWRGDRDDR